ncbi:MAG: peptidoglycan DD-metalloendopeptidase family protein [Paludibacteraceae bacterium]|nr:peptidoglycan DD-metalloendopeptidase family protein [Paludibacteraceae bacterium]
MKFKSILVSAVALMFAVSGQAQKHKTNGKRYANAVKQEQTTSKFSQFSEYEEMYPADDLYSSVWMNERVNPYNVTLPDSFKIVVSGFESPTETAHNPEVTSEYGPRWGRFHAGIDIAVRKGDSIRAAFDGQVRIAHHFDKKGYGWYVVIRHDNGLETLYGHLSKPLVKNDQRVKAGEVIGLGGSTGRSTGPHLHFETRFLGVPMNPRNIIDFDANVIYADTYTIDKVKSFSEYNRFHGLYRGRRGKNQAAIATYTRADGHSIHVVKSGDNLSRIARMYKTSVATLCALNHIDKDAILSLGKKLIVK